MKAPKWFLVAALGGLTDRLPPGLEKQLVVRNFAAQITKAHLSLRASVGAAAATPPTRLRPRADWRAHGASKSPDTPRGRRIPLRSILNVRIDPQRRRRLPRALSS
jgi:hypothetical protein